MVLLKAFASAGLLAVTEVGNLAALTVDETDSYLVILLVELMVFLKAAWMA